MENLYKNFRKCSYILLTISLCTILFSCKKDAIKVDQEMVYLQTDFKYDASFPYNGGWQVTLEPNGNAQIVPGGDIVWAGTYKIKGKLLTLNTNDSGSFEFDILSSTAIKDKKYGVSLTLKK